MGTLRLGTFDAERWWRPDDLATLPAVSSDMSATIAHMDELLAGYCAPDDLLVTRGPMADELREQLTGAGVRFRHEVLPGGADVNTAERRAMALPGFTALAQRCADIRPYAVLPDTGLLAVRLGWGDRLPDPSVVARVNSKTWSSELAGRLGFPYAGQVVRSVDELTAAVSAHSGAVVVKDPYGVSGRGMLEIGTPGVLRSIARTLDRQVTCGRRVELVVQPKLEAWWDFSAHLTLDPDGGRDWSGVVMMANRGFRTTGCDLATPEFQDRLRDAGYHDAMTRVADALAEQGYWGPVDVDSMMLADGQVVPVLEVNARQSIGRILLELSARLTGTATGHLRQLDLDVPPGRNVADLLAILRADGALYTGRSTPGVVALNGSALSAPGGRIYFFVVCEHDRIMEWQDFLTAAVVASGMRERGAVRAA